MSSQSASNSQNRDLFSDESHTDDGLIEALIGDTNLIGEDSNPIDVESANQAQEPTTSNIAARVQQISEILLISDERAWFLAAMFNTDYYKSNSHINLTCPEELFTHYITIGIYQDFSPSPTFDPKFVKTKLQELFESNESLRTEDNIEINSRPAMLEWLDYGFEKISAHALFDNESYFSTYPDIAQSVTNGYAHFATHGLYENRIPCELLKQHMNIVSSQFPSHIVSLETLFRSIPVGYSAEFIDNETQIVLNKIFMADLYRAQIEADENTSKTALYSHFLLFGGTNEKRPTALFHQHFYKDALKNFEPVFKDTDILREYSNTTDNEISNCLSVGSESSFFHWFFKGMTIGIVPTPLFDTDHYVYAHQDIRFNWKKHPFLHFIESGCREPFRKMSVLFDGNFYTQATKGLKHDDGPLLDYVMRGQFEGIAPVAGLHLEHFKSTSPYTSSDLEEAALYFAKRISRLNSTKLSQMVAKAESLEPQIMRPYGARNIRFAPVFHPEADVMHSMRAVTPKIAKQQYDTVILIPHCRMAGSAKIAGQFAHTMAELTDSESILVITTDLSAFERPEWFPENVDVFDLSQYLSNMNHERKVRMLLDIIRGLRTKRMININSNLGWHLTNNYGKQLASWTDLYFYLFCWDRDEKGNKGGYPIQWFLPTFDYCKAVFTDSIVLQDELRDRYCIGKKQQEKIVAMHTPAEDVDVSYEDVLTQRTSTNGVRRVFWSGRFDKQKRIDVLFAVATRMPQIEFWVWGKSVLNDAGIDTKTAPANIKYMGAYTSIDDVPIASCDLFLYTSGWDGLPTVLIEVGSRAVPIVASDVGGVGDLINANTGWPIKEYANPDRYCEAINEVISDYPDALQRGRNCREYALSLCNNENYTNTIRSVLGLEQKS